MRIICGIIGQERVINQLNNELASNKLAHAYLFSGFKGTGRYTTALALFKTLNCQANFYKNSSPDLNNSTNSPIIPCDRCKTCFRIIKTGQHEDFITLEPPKDHTSLQIKIEKIRELIRIISFPPFGNNWRLIVIREAEYLNLSSANALLKILEEPPPNNIFILTTQNQAELIPTLASRCRRINFNLLNETYIINELIKRGTDRNSAWTRTKLSGGSLGRALEFNYQKLQIHLIHFLKHINSYTTTTQNWTFAEKLTSNFRTKEGINRQGLIDLLNLLLHYYRDQAIIAIGHTKSTTTVLSIINEPNYSINLTTSLNVFTYLCQTQLQIIANVSPELAFSILISKIKSIKN